MFLVDFLLTFYLFLAGLISCKFSRHVSATLSLQPFQKQKLLLPPTLSLQLPLAAHQPNHSSCINQSAIILILQQLPLASPPDLITPATAYLSISISLRPLQEKIFSSPLYKPLPI
jgi:hypothetical protein